MTMSSILMMLHNTMRVKHRGTFMSHLDVLGVSSYIPRNIYSVRPLTHKSSNGEPRNLQVSCTTIGIVHLQVSQSISV